MTTFVVDSYKSLQEDPNERIVTLLAHIASRLDGSLTAPSIVPLANDQAIFTPNPSSVRINTFWFVSLVLSLTTVLIGIVSLQWLREHQSYADLSPRQAFAVFHMRSDSLKSWHIPKMFTTLPLLLQGALVLFLAGLIDFVRDFGRGVSIPVTVFAGLTLLFLISTTVLLTAQGFLLYILSIFSRSTVPSQCPLNRMPSGPCPRPSSRRRHLS